MPAEEVHHYDLFECPKGWSAVSLLIISPYVEPEFFKRLVDDMNPKMLTVVIDDGCRPDDVKMLRELAGNGTKVVVALGSAPGLVHSKIFHTEWLTAGGNRAHTLVYGSGNATHQAFSGSFNSELMCCSRLTASYNYDTVTWLQRVRAAADESDTGVKVGGLRTELVKGVHFRLPEIIIKGASSKADNFDLWLQRGHLLSAYKPDAGFLRVAVPLKKKLPPGDLEKRIKAAGIGIPQISKLSIPYVSIDDPPGEGGRWRSQLFTETDLGEWCSEACSRDKSHLFRKNGYDKREESLKCFGAMLIDRATRSEAKSAYVSRIEELWKVFGSSAGTYLETLKGRVHLDHYSRELEESLKRDANLAKDREFRSRYLDGFAVVPVPRLRLDAAAWATFREYFIAQLHYNSLKQRAPGLLFRRVKSALGKAAAASFTPDKLALFFETEWNSPAKCRNAGGLTVGEYIDDYHREPFDDTEEADNSPAVSLQSGEMLKWKPSSHSHRYA